MKYIFVTGGVVSGLGKGICAASLGRLLKQCGLRVRNQKFDPYLNVDPGTMSPYQHGEVFVTEDGAETDLDLGHYERFTDEDLTVDSSITSGKVYWSVLSREREGAFLGGTVQVIPHITGEIKERIYRVGRREEADVVITEIGGTTGDIESQPFLEAIRQVGLEQGKENCCFIHVVLVPYISGSDEYKSKPAQHSVKELQGMGVSPDIIILRADGSVGSDIRRKISTFCNVKPECVIENLTMPSLYQCPLMLHTGGLDDVVVKQLHLDVPPADLTEWKEMLARIATRSKTCTIALVGKYVKLHDAYLSVMESLYHAGFENDSQVEIKWVESEDLPDQAACREAFADVDGIIAYYDLYGQGVYNAIAENDNFNGKNGDALPMASVDIDPVDVTNMQTRPDIWTAAGTTDWTMNGEIGMRILMLELADQYDKIFDPATGESGVDVVEVPGTAIKADALKSDSTVENLGNIAGETYGNLDYLSAADWMPKDLIHK